MTTTQWQQADAAHIAATYGRFPTVLQSGHGCTVMDTDGKEYLDFTSGIGVNSLGFCDTAWADAVATQAHTLQHTSNLYYTQPCITLAETLCARTGMQKVFFANSGAEANEGAIKTARKYSHDKYGAGRSKIITLVNSFHGRTMATLTATGQQSFHTHFAPFLDGFAYVEAGDIAALQQALDGTVCALMLEMVQGEGGVIPLDADYVAAAAALCAQHDVLLVVDEVQTGIGRTGTLLACEQFGLAPDIITLAKGLGGGLPLGAVLFGEKTKNTLTPGTHGSTYGGNPVVCAGANVVLARLTPSFLADVAAKGAALRKGLAALPHVESVAGMGLMLGVAFTDGIEAKTILTAAMQQGLLCLTAKTKLRLLPPLTVTMDEINTALHILQGVLEKGE